ncbi:hypothetical protein LUZ63_005899 [Rhynchospora breviuscula]|uniref:Uncharacterized protein n=1 Tax=Rhynchospora breviuscula TaxID=2022672 RepID=A0A9Q0CPE6_9POAL|nr:hypothetical protein LUZ63_005899 [Rhynchospora breviuscula]
MNYINTHSISHIYCQSYNKHSSLITTDKKNHSRGKEKKIKTKFKRSTRDRFEGSKLLEIGPNLLPHNGHILRHLSFGIFRLYHQPIVHPCHHLFLSLHHSHELQPIFRSLVVLRHGVFSEVRHVLICQVLDRRPTSCQRLSCGGELRSGE